jgi:hypothetical protein
MSESEKVSSAEAEKRIFIPLVKFLEKSSLKQKDAVCGGKRVVYFRG